MIKIKEMDKKIEEEKQRQYAEQKEDPEWYAMKMAARVEKERDHLRGDDRTVAAICELSKSISGGEVPGRGTAEEGMSPKGTEWLEGAKAVMRPKRQEVVEGAKEVLELKG